MLVFRYAWLDARNISYHLVGKTGEQYTVSGGSLLFLDHSFCAPLNIYRPSSCGGRTGKDGEKEDRWCFEEGGGHPCDDVVKPQGGVLPPWGHHFALRGGKRKGYCTHINIDFGHLFRATVGTKAMAMHHNFIWKRTHHKNANEIWFCIIYFGFQHQLHADPSSSYTNTYYIPS